MTSRVALLAVLLLATEGCAAAADPDEADGEAAALSGADTASIACEPSSASFPLLHRESKKKLDVTLAPGTVLVVEGSNGKLIQISDASRTLFVPPTEKAAFSNDAAQAKRYQLDVTQTLVAEGQARFTTRCTKLREGMDLYVGSGVSDGVCRGAKSSTRGPLACVCTSEIRDYGTPGTLGTKCQPRGADCTKIEDPIVRLACIAAAP